MNRAAISALARWPRCAMPLVLGLACAGFSSAQETPTGQELVRNSALRLQEMRSVEARLRQRIDLFGHQLVGSGTYLQRMGPDNGPVLLRLEMKLQVDNHVTSLQQVCDGRFLWIRRDAGSGASLSRIDLRRVQQAMQQHDSTDLGDSTTWLAFGGLPKLMQGLAENFEFGIPRADSISDLPVWVISGRWQPHKLEKLLPAQAEAIRAGRPPKLEALPAHLPDSVTVVLGRDDRLPLFPYRVEYRRKLVTRENEAGSSVPMVTLELFEVRRRDDLDPRTFAYEPGDQQVADHTVLFLKRFGLANDPQGPRSASTINDPPR